MHVCVIGVPFTLNNACRFPSNQINTNHINQIQCIKGFLLHNFDYTINRNFLLSCISWFLPITVYHCIDKFVHETMCTSARPDCACFVLGIGIIFYFISYWYVIGLHDVWYDCWFLILRTHFYCCLHEYKRHLVCYLIS
jgi:hypothetical protein